MRDHNGTVMPDIPRDGLHRWEERSAMFVRDRMSSPAVTATPDTVFRDALSVMRKHRFRRLPVIDEDGKLIGIVCERDLVYASPSQTGSLSVWELNHLLSHVQIRQLMTENVITATADTPVEDVAQLMTDNKIGGLPVVDEHSRVIGIITETDIFKAFVEMFAGGHSGLRLTLEIPETKDVLLELAEAISDLGGTIVSVGSYYGEEPDKRGLVVKIRGASEDEVVEALEALGDHIVDAREV